MNVGLRENWLSDDDVVTLRRPEYHFSEVVLDAAPASISECAVALRPLIEQLANMAGRSKSSSFAPNGEYLHAFT